MKLASVVVLAALWSFGPGLFGSGLSGSVSAAEANGPTGGKIYPLETEAQVQQFQELTAELRCPKCQNQNIADSNAPIAKDMRDEVYRRIQAGESSETITSELVDRFGEFVRYKPVVDERTWALWFLPILVVLIGLPIIYLIVRGSRRQAATGTGKLSEADRAKAEALLKHASESSESRASKQDGTSSS